MLNDYFKTKIELLGSTAGEACFTTKYIVVRLGAKYTKVPFLTNEKTKNGGNTGRYKWGKHTSSRLLKYLKENYKDGEVKLWFYIGDDDEE